MKLAERMPTFVRLYRVLAAIRQSPNIAFLVACVIATAVLPLLWKLTEPSVFLSETLFLFIPIWLPVLAGNAALLFWSRKQPSFRPSLLLRFLILVLVMEGFFLVFRYRNPQVRPEYAVMEEVAYMSLYGAQCVVLLIMEPWIRSHLRKRRALDHSSI